MRIEDKKYIWWGLLGIGVAAFFYFLSQRNAKSGGTNTVTVPYLVPQSTTGASPTADTSLSNQPNIIGSSSNSTVPNFSNPYAVSANPTEAPGTWGFMPSLWVKDPQGIQNALSSGSFDNGNSIMGSGIPGVNSPLHVYCTPGGACTQ